MKCNLKIVDFIDVTLKFTDSTYKPYRKPDAEISYIHKESNHPLSITKQLSISIEARLPSNKNIFERKSIF